MHLQHVWVVTLCTLLAGCQWYDPADVTCYGDHHCPATMQCVSGSCEGAESQGLDDDDTSGNMICTDTCSYAGDGECDDGGPGSAYDVCAYGTDCTDCGPRSPM